MVTLLLEHEVDVDPLDFVAAYEGRRACKCRSCVAYRGGKTIRRLPRFFANMPLTRMSPEGPVEPQPPAWSVFPTEGQPLTDS